MKIQKLKFSCEVCSNKFYVYPARVRAAQKINSSIRFCSRKCFIRPVEKLCLYCEKSFKVTKAREKTAKYCSKECMKQFWIKTGKYAEQNNHFWDGGKTKKSEFVRFTKEYKEWRKNIFERDDYTCKMCGKRGYRLNADHIKPQSKFPELRFNLNNGRTLCVDCHRQTNTWGFRLNPESIYKPAIKNIYGK